MSPGWRALSAPGLGCFALVARHQAEHGEGGGEGRQTEGQRQLLAFSITSAQHRIGLSRTGQDSDPDFSEGGDAGAAGHAGGTVSSENSISRNTL